MSFLIEHETLEVEENLSNIIATFNLAKLHRIVSEMKFIKTFKETCNMASAGDSLKGSGGI